VAFGVAFNTEKLLWEMNYGRDHLLEKLCGIKLSPAARQELDSIFVDVCSTLDREDKIICHRDYHSRNVMIKHGKTRVIDFQDARLGTMQYDLVSLTHDSYVDLNDASRGEILDYYLSCAKEFRTSPIARDQFFAIFRLQMVQRCFKACGSFASFYNMREDTRYLKYLEPTIKKVAAALEQYSQYSTFLNLLRDNGLLEMNFEDPTHLKKS
jgi:aminoglycoside/choline kinase family phosphotransferase